MENYQPPCTAVSITEFLPEIAIAAAATIVGIKTGFYLLQRRYERDLERREALAELVRDGEITTDEMRRLAQHYIIVQHKSDDFVIKKLESLHKSEIEIKRMYMQQKSAEFEAKLEQVDDVDRWAFAFALGIDRKKSDRIYDGLLERRLQYQESPYQVVEYFIKNVETKASVGKVSNIIGNFLLGKNRSGIGERASVFVELND